MGDRIFTYIGLVFFLSAIFASCDYIFFTPVYPVSVDYETLNRENESIATAEQLSIKIDGNDWYAISGRFDNRTDLDFITFFAESAVKVIEFRAFYALSGHIFHHNDPFVWNNQDIEYPVKLFEVYLDPGTGEILRKVVHDSFIGSPGKVELSTSEFDYLALKVWAASGYDKGNWKVIFR